MALAAISDVVEADIGDARPEWHHWHSPTGRWYAARTAPLADPKTGAMIVSADTLGDLMTAVVHASPATVRV